MDIPLFSVALILRALSVREPLGPRDAGAFLERRTRGALRLGNTVHQPIPTMVRRGLIVADGMRAPARGGGLTVQLYRRTDLGVQVAETYSATVRALYSAPAGPPGANANEGVRVYPPVNSAAIALEVLRTQNMSAIRIGELYAAKVGAVLVPSQFSAACRTLRRGGLIEPLYCGAKEIVYNITAAGQKHASRYRDLVLALYTPDDSEAEDDDGPATERDLLPWFMGAEEPIPEGRAWGWYTEKSGRRPRTPTTREGLLIYHACRLLRIPMATLAERLGIRNSMLSRVISAQRRLSRAYVDGIHKLVLKGTTG